MTDQSKPRFVLDASVFIGAHRIYYPIDFCPGFWDCLLRHFHGGRLLSIDKVRDELLDISKSEDVEPDALFYWTLAAPSGLFISTGEQSVENAYKDLIAWVNSRPQYFEEAKNEFARKADGWLIAFAQVHNTVVITQEVSAPKAKTKVPIPNVCDQFGVPYVNTFDMLRQLGVRFILDSTI